VRKCGLDYRTALHAHVVGRFKKLLLLPASRRARQRRFPAVNDKMMPTPCDRTFARRRGRLLPDRGDYPGEGRTTREYRIGARCLGRWIRLEAGLRTLHFHF
jgi:hypothetical protein